MLLIYSFSQKGISYLEIVKAHMDTNYTMHAWLARESSGVAGNMSGLLYFMGAGSGQVMGREF